MNYLKLNALKELNEKIFNKGSIFKSEIRFSKNLMMGVFDGDNVLFISQNPGMPVFSKDGLDRMQYEEMDFDSVQENYKIAFYSCKLGLYVISLAAHALNYSINDVSFTNVVKYSTINNQCPEKKHLLSFKKILFEQIKILKPKCIIALGSYAHSALQDWNPYYIAHPASHRYSTSQLKLDIKIIKEIINENILCSSNK